VVAIGIRTMTITLGMNLMVDPPSGIEEEGRAK
jgi:hypothetical protein